MIIEKMIIDPVLSRNRRTKYDYARLRIKSKKLPDAVADGWIVTTRCTNRSTRAEITIENGSEIVIVLRREKDEQDSCFV